jgi:hypothetical protein
LTSLYIQLPLESSIPKQEMNVHMTSVSRSCASPSCPTRIALCCRRMDCHNRDPWWCAGNGHLFGTGSSAPPFRQLSQTGSSFTSMSGSIQEMEEHEFMAHKSPLFLQPADHADACAVACFVIRYTSLCVRQNVSSFSFSSPEIEIDT